MYFLRAMQAWIATHNVAYETYVNGQDNLCRTFSFASGHFPHAAATYRTLRSKPF